MSEMEKENNRITQWLEDFKSKYGDHEDAKEIINEVETAMKSYVTNIVSAKAKIEIQKAVEARRAQGSVLEYGLKYHLDNFVRPVTIVIITLISNEFQLKEGVPTDPRWPDRRDKYLEDRQKDLNLLSQWLEDFKSKYASFEDAAPVIAECEDAIKLYNSVICMLLLLLFCFNVFFQYLSKDVLKQKELLKLEELKDQYQNMVSDITWMVL